MGSATEWPRESSELSQILRKTKPNAPFFGTKNVFWFKKKRLFLGGFPSAGRARATVTAVSNANALNVMPSDPWGVSGRENQSLYHDEIRTISIREWEREREIRHAQKDVVYKWQSGAKTRKRLCLGWFTVMVLHLKSVQGLQRESMGNPWRLYMTLYSHKTQNMEIIPHWWSNSLVTSTLRAIPSVYVESRAFPCTQRAFVSVVSHWCPKPIQSRNCGWESPLRLTWCWPLGKFEEFAFDKRVLLISNHNCRADWLLPGCFSSPDRFPTLVALNQSLFESVISSKSLTLPQIHSQGLVLKMSVGVQ